MRPYVITVASTKGGAGKTTLAGHLAVQAEATNAGPVALVDADPQGSLSSWWNERKAERPLFVKTTPRTLRGKLEELHGEGIRLVLLDTPPAISEAIRTAIDVADLVLIPTRPSPHDLRSIGSTIDLVEAAGKPAIFVVNGATVRSRISADAAIALSQHGTVAPVTVHQRIDFASSMIDGRTVMESHAGSNSAREITTLWEYVLTQLRKRVTAQERKHAPSKRT